MVTEAEASTAGLSEGLPPRWTRLARTLAVLSWITLTVLSLLPGEDRPHTGAPGNVEHAVAYLLAAGLTGLGFPRVRLAAALAAFSVAAGLFELCQTVIPGRSPGVDNWASSTAGALAGLLAAHLFRRARGVRSLPGGTTSPGP